MIRRYLVITTFIVALMVIGSCGKDFNIDKWRPDMLMPFVKGTATMEDLADLKDKIFIQKIPPFDIGIQSTSVPIPVTTIKLGYVGPYPYLVSEYFSYVQVDSAKFKISLDNVFPLTINKGTRVDFRTQADTSNPNNMVFSHTIEHDVPPYTTYNFFTDVSNKFVPNVMYMYLQNFSATNPNNGQVIFDPNPGQLVFEIKFLSVSKVALNSSREYAITDTASIEFGDDSKVDDYEDSAVVGMLTLHLTNKVPVNFDFQIYFYQDMMSPPIDSFYTSDMKIGHADTDGAGNPTNVVTESFKLPLTAERVTRLKTATFVSYKLAGNTNHVPPGLVLLANKQCIFEAQIVGDVKIKIASFMTFF